MRGDNSTANSDVNKAGKGFQTLNQEGLNSLPSSLDSIVSGFVASDSFDGVRFAVPVDIYTRGKEDQDVCS